jgi:hypothetical protein
MKNRILAMEAAPAAIPVKPKTAAIIATTRNMTVQRSIEKNLSEKIQFTVNRFNRFNTGARTLLLYTPGTGVCI